VRQTERQTEIIQAEDRKAERQTDVPRQTDRQPTDKYTYRQTDREACRQTDRKYRLTIYKQPGADVFHLPNS
jgi:hypothetical protein